VWQVTRSIFIDIDDATMRQRIISRAPTAEEEIQKRIVTADMERQLAKEICTDVIDGS
jgi:guanylate kinase